MNEPAASRAETWPIVNFSAVYIRHDQLDLNSINFIQQYKISNIRSKVDLKTVYAKTYDLMSERK